MQTFSLRPLGDYLRDSERVRRDAVACGIKADCVAEIVVAAAELLRRPERLADLQRCAQDLFGGQPWPADAWRDTPRDSSAGERYFFVLPFLQQLPTLQAWYAARNIPQAVLQATLSDFQIWFDTEVRRSGHFEFRQPAWLLEHFNGRLFRLGRLQFQPSVFCPPFTPLVNRRTGTALLVAHAGRTITPQGIFSDSEGATGTPLELRYEEQDGEVRLGHVVTPNGYIATRPTQFAAGEWLRAIYPREPALALHIPAGEPLCFEACCDAFRQAATFFPRYFPDHPAYRAVTCSSWLFYPGLRDVLPPDANIVRFQRAFLCFPVPAATAHQAWERAFEPYGAAIRPDQLRGRLQQRLYEHVQQGHLPINAGGAVLAPFTTYGANCHEVGHG